MKIKFQLTVVTLCCLIGQQVLAFTDISWDTALYRAVSYMTTRNIISGYDDGSFGVNDPINKAAALKIILTAAEVDIPDEFEIPENFYTDVPEDAWFTPFVVAALNEQILKIDPEDTNAEFHPGNEVNRAAFIKMMLATFGVVPDRYKLEEVEISDVPDDAWFAPYIKFTVKFEVLELTENGEAFPSQTITRGETVKYLYETLKQGGGLSPQTLLMLTESHLVQTIEKIESKQFPGAGLAVDIAEKFISLTLKILPENNIVNGAHKTVLAVKNLVGAYAAGEVGHLEDVLKNSGNAWNLANEAGELNPSQSTMTEAIKHLAHGLAARTREIKEQVEEEREKISSAEGEAEAEEKSDGRKMQEALDQMDLGKEASDTEEEVEEKVTEEVIKKEELVDEETPAEAETEEVFLSEEEELMKKLEEIRAQKKAAVIEAKKKAEEEEKAKKAAAKKKAEEEAARVAAESAAKKKAEVEASEKKKKEVEEARVAEEKADTSGGASSTSNAVIKAQLGALTPVLGQIDDGDPMKAIVTAQLKALEQVLLQPDFNKDLVLAQLGVLEPVIDALQNEGIKNIVLAQLGALKLVVSNL